MAKQATKKSVKKSAKKEEPKIILIDGLYSHKFNVRILPKSGKAMTDMMTSKGLKSFNKAINVALEEYQLLKDEINRLREIARSCEENFDRAHSVVTDFKNALINLQELKFDHADNKSTGKKQSEIGMCSNCGTDEEPVYIHKGFYFCEGCLEFQ